MSEKYKKLDRVKHAIKNMDVWFKSSEIKDFLEKSPIEFDRQISSAYIQLAVFRLAKEMKECIIITKTKDRENCYIRKWTYEELKEYENQVKTYPKSQSKEKS